MCRALEAFLLAQMPSNTLLRLEAKAPGYVREPKKVQERFMKSLLLFHTRNKSKKTEPTKGARTNLGQDDNAWFALFSVIFVFK